MVKKNDIHNEIKESLLETLDFIKGKQTDGRVVYFLKNEEICPREIREDLLGVDRAVFGEYFNLSVNSQRNWELGLRTPSEHTLSYYKLIKTDPKVVYEMLHGESLPVNNGHHV